MATVTIIRTRATADEVRNMLATLGGYIKLAVDVERGILAGGGEYHADCEDVLLDDGSRQEALRGADWYPDTRAVAFGALINIRPAQGNRTLEIADPAVRAAIERVVRGLLEDPV